MCLVKIRSEEVSFNVKSIGVEGEVVRMDKFGEIQQLTHQLHVHGGPKDVNDSSSDKDNDEKENSESDILYPEKFAVLFLAQRYQQTLCTL